MKDFLMRSLVHGATLGQERDTAGAAVLTRAPVR